MPKKISELKKEAIKASGLPVDSRWKSWVKWVDSVNQEEVDGYAFVGDFVEGGTIEYEIGAPKLLLVASESGSAKYKSFSYQVVLMKADGELEPIEDLYDGGKTKGWALRLRDKVASYLAEISGEIVNPLAQFSDQEIIDEAKRRGYYVEY